jgi:hypothetical protein
MNTSLEKDATEHFRLVLGFDAKTDQVIYHEPAEPDGAYQRLSRAQFFKLWPLKYTDREWTVIRLRLEAKHIRPAPRRDGLAPSDFVQHIMPLRQGLAQGFTVVVEPPFVVLGNGPAREVHRHAKETIGWATRMLRRDFFAHDPDHILDVWLLRDDQSYQWVSRRLTGEAPDTPYGYYSPAHRALVMNIATGGGTLVHEIVHPFMERNCPSCPAWFNEGLGSLFERCAERDGHIVGLPNWRLASLQQDIRQHALPGFRALTRLTGRNFYAGSVDHYAQARYLLYDLQERGRLIPYYQALRAGLHRDPTGYAALVRVLGGVDMGRYQRRWERAMLALTEEP